MLKSSNMARIDIDVPEQYLNNTSAIIAQCRSIHLINIKKDTPGKIENRAIEQETLINRYQQLGEKLKSILKHLSIDQNEPLKQKESSTEQNEQEDIFLKTDPEMEITTLENMTQEINDQVISFIEKQGTIDDLKNNAKKCLNDLKLLQPANIDLAYFTKHEFIHLTVGFIPDNNLDRLKRSLENMYHVLIPDLIAENRRLLFVLCSIKDKEKLDKIFNSAYFEKILLPENKEYDNIQQAIEDLSNRISKLEIQERELKKKLGDIGDILQSRLNSLLSKTLAYKSILTIKQSCVHIGKMYHISGWIPSNICQELDKKILDATNQSVKVSISSENSSEENQKNTTSKPPTHFKNPKFIKPFENLVCTYGIPGYREIEPTFIFAVSFLIMFGVMFGDIGHGLVLFLLGVFAYKSSHKKFNEIGIIVLECGISSTIFGFLYGSIFGFEHLIPALWFQPMGNIYYFMKVTIGFGIAMISFALLFNIINSIKNRDYLTGVFGEFGLMGFLFYWGSIVLAMIYLAKGKMFLGFKFSFAIIATPLFIIFFKEPIYKIIFKKDKNSIMPENIGLFLMESFIEVIDTIIGYLSSTVSFIRVCAFSLAHAGLFLAVFSLANSLRQVKGGAFLYIITVVLGNVLIIAIEGLVVSIQTIRLEYYEFFSKFFKGGGERFNPLEIK